MRLPRSPEEGVQVQVWLCVCVSVCSMMQQLLCEQEVGRMKMKC